MSTNVLKALPGTLDIKRHSPCILYLRDKHEEVSFAYVTLSFTFIMMTILCNTLLPNFNPANLQHSN